MPINPFLLMLTIGSTAMVIRTARGKISRWPLEVFLFALFIACVGALSSIEQLPIYPLHRPALICREIALFVFVTLAAYVVIACIEFSGASLLLFRSFHQDLPAWLSRIHVECILSAITWGFIAVTTDIARVSLASI